MDNKIQVGVILRKLRDDETERIHKQLNEVYALSNDELEVKPYDPKLKQDIVFNFIAGGYISFATFYRARKNKQKLIYRMWETPNIKNHTGGREKRLHKIYDYIITWDDDLVDNKYYFSFKYSNIKKSSYKISLIDEVQYVQMKLAVMINSNRFSNSEGSLYSERRNIIDFFELTNENIFDLYGYDWGHDKSIKNYKGTVKNKTDTYKNYKFIFCLENHYGRAGYITEKIFDAFIVGRVPIYKGASNVLDYIPQNTFINYDNFNNLEELTLYLKKMSLSQYNQYLMNIEIFLNSKKAELFSEKYNKNVIQKFLVDVYMKRIPKHNIQEDFYILQFSPRYYWNMFLWTIKNNRDIFDLCKKVRCKMHF